jgi:hypothetical protein
MQALRHFEEKSMRLVRTFAVVLVASVPLPAASQSQPPAAEPYRPGLGDLMTMTVQPRHIKLALAGRENNWAYAKYELHELQEAFERIVRVWPKYKRLPLGGVIDAIAKGPMAEIAKTIHDKNSEQFAAAYAALTEGCNACHEAANVGFVVIKVPDSASFPDQDFGRQKP